MVRILLRTKASSGLNEYLNETVLPGDCEVYSLLAGLGQRCEPGMERENLGEGSSRVELKIECSVGEGTYLWAWRQPS